MSTLYWVSLSVQLLPSQPVRKQKSSLCHAVLSGDHTKALIGQLIIFNQILGELRLDIREQVRKTGEAGRQTMESERQGRSWSHGFCGLQVKEMALIRNSIMECQVCGESVSPASSSDWFFSLRTQNYFFLLIKSVFGLVTDSAPTLK